MKLFVTLFVVFLVGLSTFFRKLAVDRIHPYQIQVVAGLLYALGIPLWLWLLATGGRQAYDPIGVFWSVLCVATSVASAVLFSRLLQTSGSPGVLSMILASNPLVVMTLSHVFLGEEITFKKFVGCLVTIVGLSLLSG